MKADVAVAGTYSCSLPSVSVRHGCSVTLLCKKYFKTGKTEFDISFIALDIQSIIAVFVDRISRNVIISLVNFA